MNKRTALLLLLAVIPWLFGCSHSAWTTETAKNGGFEYAFPEGYSLPEDVDPEWDLAMEDRKLNKAFFLFFYPKDDVAGYAAEDILAFHAAEIQEKTESVLWSKTGGGNLLGEVYKNTHGGAVMASFLSVMTVDEGYLFTMQTCPFDDMAKNEREFHEIINSVVARGREQS